MKNNLVALGFSGPDHRAGALDISLAEVNERPSISPAMDRLSIEFADESSDTVTVSLRTVAADGTLTTNAVSVPFSAKLLVELAGRRQATPEEAEGADAAEEFAAGEAALDASRAAELTSRFRQRTLNRLRTLQDEAAQQLAEVSVWAAQYGLTGELNAPPTANRPHDSAD